MPDPVKSGFMHRQFSLTHSACLCRPRRAKLWKTHARTAGYCHPRVRLWWWFSALGVMKRGSVLVCLGSVQHGGGANRTDRYRAQLLAGLAPTGGTAIPYGSREITRTLPERLQLLLGYLVHEPNLGSLEGHDPIGLLTGALAVNGHFREFLPEEVRLLLAEHRTKLKA